MYFFLDLKNRHSPAQSPDIRDSALGDFNCLHIAHVAAFRGAFAACLGAFFAMLQVRMLITFFCTGITNLRTERTDLFGKRTSARHGFYCQKADGGAVAVQLDAMGEHFHVLLLQASTCAMQAFDCAIGAGGNTTLILLMTHFVLF